MDILPQKIKVIGTAKSPLNELRVNRVKPQDTAVPLLLHDIKQLPVYSQPEK